MSTTHFIELVAEGDDEIAGAHVFVHLFEHFHRGLASFGIGTVAVSFPDYIASSDGKRLGQRLRLHGDGKQLDEFMHTGWHRKLSDYVRVGTVASAPGGDTRLVVRRIQVKSSSERLIRRAAKRNGWTVEVATKKYEGFEEKRSDLPFLELRSASTRQKFRLFVAQEKAVVRTDHGFGAYGLSSGGTVPWF